MTTLVEVGVKLNASRTLAPTETAGPEAGWALKVAFSIRVARELRTQVGVIDEAKLCGGVICVSDGFKS